MRKKWIVKKGTIEKAKSDGRKVKVSKSQPTVQYQTEQADVLMTET
jgi:hypothetical protein